MSGELARVLWSRSRVFLEEAERLAEQGHYDVALVLAEQAAQLAVKAAYSLVLGYAPRGHSLRRLLGYLAGVLEEAGRSREAGVLRGFVAENRGTLVLLEDAYAQGRYGLPGYTGSEARSGIEAARRLRGLLASLIPGLAAPEAGEP